MRIMRVNTLLSVLLFIFTIVSLPACKSKNKDKRKRGVSGLLHREKPGKGFFKRKRFKRDGKRASKLKIVTWNIQHMGGSKDKQELTFMAKLIQSADIVAIQEVVTSPKGRKAVQRLDAILDSLSGTQWNYKISPETSGRGSERYAFLYKPSKVRLKKAWLDQSIESEVDREPYIGRFRAKGHSKDFLVASFHAVPTKKKPAREIRLLDRIARKYKRSRMFFMGDFNLSQKHRAFQGLKRMGYAPVLVKQKTSIKMRRRGREHLAHEYDNIFYSRNLKVLQSGVMDFSRRFRKLKTARKISDHIPVFAIFRP